MDTEQVITILEELVLAKEPYMVVLLEVWVILLQVKLDWLLDFLFV